MKSMGELFATADWKAEKHVPVIEAPEAVKKGEVSKVTVSIGKEIAHPNTTEHHIRWIDVYFHAEGEKFAFLIGRGSFEAHGESVQGPNTSTIYTHHEVTLAFKTDKPGVIIASSHCNIHGLWQNSKELKVQ